MIIEATDDYGRIEQLTSDKIRKVLDLLDDYMKGEPYTIAEIRQNDLKDVNERIDVEIIRTGGKGLYRQKLLILKGEVVDGETFHKRYHEWY